MLVRLMVERLFDACCIQKVISLIPPECCSLTCKKRLAASYRQPAGAASSPDCDSWGKSVASNLTRPGAEPKWIFSVIGRAAEVMLKLTAGGELWYRSSVPSNTAKLPASAG